MSEGDVECELPAAGKPDERSPLDPERVEERDSVIHIGVPRRRSLGAPDEPAVVRDAAKRVCQRAQLRLEDAPIAETEMEEHDSRPVARFLDPEASIVDFHVHPATIASATWATKTFSSSARGRWAPASRRWSLCP